jgi:hypothetical protein
MESLVTAPNLDELFSKLRRSVEGEIARGQQDLIEHFTKALSRMRAASNEQEWNAAVVESGKAFAGNPTAIEFLAKLVALTAPKSSAMPAKEDLTAQRFARVKVAEIQLYQSPAVKAGRVSRDLYGTLQPEIDAARDAFRERFLTPGNETGDYLHAELVRELANEDATLLGPGYPGPMA